MQHFLTRSPDSRGQNMTALEVRDAATQAWHSTDDDKFNVTMRSLRDLGLEPAHGTAQWRGVPCISLVANDDTVLVLEFDPMQDGFDYDGSADDADELGEDEDEPTSFIASLEALAARLGGDDGALILEAVGRLGAEDA
jgi:hypothetical protein